MTEGTTRSASFTPTAFVDAANVDAETRASLYRRSLEDGDGFWADQAERFIDWFTPWDTVRSGDFAAGSSRWFDGARLNASYNCLDRHLEAHGDRTAISWEGDGEHERRVLSYRELHEAVCRLANALRGLGVKSGDRVCVYLPPIPEAVIAMLACARIGAVHVVVFSTFSPGALRDRIVDAGCSLLITADEGRRGGRAVPIKANADTACRESGESIKRVIVVRRERVPQDDRKGADGRADQNTSEGADAQTDGAGLVDRSGLDWHDGRDLWYHELVHAASASCAPVELDADHPLFILYTSGSGGRLKGIEHATGGYLLYAATTHHHVFDHKSDDVHWCAADLGWITAHTYGVYGPLANGASTVMIEGNPRAWSAARFWGVLDRHRVSVMYAASTLMRALRVLGDDAVRATRRSDLRLLGTVGEPIDPGSWTWLWETVGDGRCPIVATWWQTETGGIVLAPLPGATPLKPGAAGRPFFGIEAALLDEHGQEIETTAEGDTAEPARGQLVIKRAWPGQARSIHGDHERFVERYFDQGHGRYRSGDSASRDADGDYWITGHLDDTITVSGQRLGTVDIESALMSHPAVAEAAVVAYPHPDGDQGVYAWITPMHGIDGDDALREALRQHVRGILGEAAMPHLLQWTPALPKTRSGKIVRRLLKKIVGGDDEDLGDTSTLADPSVLEGLVARARSDRARREGRAGAVNKSGNDAG